MAVSLIIVVATELIAANFAVTQEQKSFLKGKPRVYFEECSI